MFFIKSIFLTVHKILSNHVGVLLSKIIPHTKTCDIRMKFHSMSTDFDLHKISERGSIMEGCSMPLEDLAAIPIHGKHV